MPQRLAGHPDKIVSKHASAAGKLAHSAGGPATAGGRRLGFPRAMRLLKRAEYEAVYGAGQRRSSPQFSVFYRARFGPSGEVAGHEHPRPGFSSAPLESAAGTGPTGMAETPGKSAVSQPAEASVNRFGISVKKALGGAVVRNRIRRRIREILRRNQTEIPRGWDIVIHPRSSVARAEFAPLEAELVRLLRSLPGSFPNSAPRSVPQAAQNPKANPKTNPNSTAGPSAGPKAGA